jgi:hypothetical protein
VLLKMAFNGILFPKPKYESGGVINYYIKKRCCRIKERADFNICLLLDFVFPPHKSFKCLVL